MYAARSLLGVCLTCVVIATARCRDKPHTLNTIPPHAAHAQCWSGRFPPAPSPRLPAVPSYIIDLDLPPLYRYHKLVEDQATNLHALVTTVRQRLPFHIPGAWRLIETVSGIIGSLLPYPFNEEIRGLALGTGLPLGDVALINILYELTAMCTSIVARSADRGRRLMHARNLDFGLAFGWDANASGWLLPEYLRPLTVQLDYRRRNRTVFRTAGFAGMVGVLTGVRPAAFALTTNERFTTRPGLWYIVEWMWGRRLQWNTVITRQVLENATSYDQARAILTQTPLIAPAYFILSGVTAGKGEGAVITRGQYKVDVWLLGEPSEWQPATWYLLQTNYDHWRTAPWYDDRRAAGIACMDRWRSGNLTEAAVFSVLNSKPLRNKLTVYTSLMTPHDGRLSTWLQLCDEPDCSLW